ncbi:hypothetical protein [Paraburkholderia megapolitana]|uniref:Killing trait domain-containing protein n=1 Tax=Paraburkholderia megapolitana TaxID=420953 RepID=A0A1I3DSQ0_9BURK|nr:hypothetical protein [Paraburkholderia megapolitana]QDQ79744.1 hypothetical protein FNZ07_00345 [Paraburkholderia megapolitana]SFH89578.1 hypothetical protein SAMN05192543_101493 [Paraburkholderia megapolitana]
MTAPTSPNNGSTNTGDVQNQANQLIQAQEQLTAIQFQVQSSTSTFQTTGAVTAAAGTAASQAADHIGSAGRS